MRYDEYDDYPPVRSVSGVAPAWRVLAVLGISASAALLLLGCALTLVVLHQGRQPAGSTTVPPFAAQGAPMNPGGADDEEPPNPPYPLVADMRPEGQPLIPGEPTAAAPTARDRFLQLSRDVWSDAENQYPQDVTISPDGKYIAFVSGQTLRFGPLNGGGPVIAGPAGVFPGQAVGGGPGPGLQFGGLVDSSVVGAPAWSPNSRFLYFTDTAGRVQRYAVATGEYVMALAPGDLPAAVPGGGEKLIIRRSRPIPKADTARGEAYDPAEVVLVDPASQASRVLVQGGPTRWEQLAVSPDGTMLALVSGTDWVGVQPPKSRLHLLDLKKPGSLPKPLTSPDLFVSQPCWTPDSRFLLYARSQQPMPPDC